MRQFLTTGRRRRTRNSAAAAAAALLLMAGFGSAARAQDSGSIPPAPTGAGAGSGGTGTIPSAAPGQTGAPGAGQTPPGVPPLPVLLGFADFMLTLDRPYEAQKIYKNILLFDPRNEFALRGLEDAKRAAQPTVTFLGHSYYDSEDTQLFAYGGGPVLRFPGSRLTITSGTGYYKNNNNPNNRRNPARLDPTLVPTAADNFALRQTTFNALWEPYFGRNMEYEGSVFLSQKNYDAAPDRFLYDFRLSYIPQAGRKKFTLGTGRKDSFYQNQINQFLAPESYFQIAQKILFDDYYVGVEYPLASKWDFIFNYRHFEYTDGNTRDNFRQQFMYRILPNNPTRPMPVWRVGLDGVIDEAKFFTLTYGIPDDFRSLSIATDYVMVTRDLKYGGYFSVPVWRKNFAPPIGFVGFINKNIGPNNEIYFKSIILEARNLSISIYDYVLGINTRF